MNVIPSSRWSAFRKTCISWRSFRSSAPSGSSRSSTFGPVDDRARERDALPLAARELDRLAVAVAAEAHHVEHLVHLAAARVARDALHLEAVADVLADRHVREERVVLEDGVDVARVRRLPGDVLAAERDPARVGLLEAGDHAQRRRLAGARRAEQREELARGDCQVDAVDGNDIAVCLTTPFDCDVSCQGSLEGCRAPSRALRRRS